jgi:hypothetical protein
MSNNVVKNISYPNFEYMCKKSFVDKVDIIKKINESKDDMISWDILYQQYKIGANFFIKKSVTDELLKTDLKNIKYEDIRFPFDSTEIYFEDIDIPTVIIQNFKNILPFLFTKKDMDSLSLEEKESFSIYKKSIRDVYNNGFRMLSQDKIENGRVIFNTIQWSDFQVDEWLNNDYFIKSQTCFQEMSKEESNDHKNLFKLIVKVFLYISIPEYKAIPITKNQLQMAGKPGVKNRPNRPTFKVIYVPSVINTNKKESVVNNEAKKTPHFRRGHFMMLRDERYKENKGKLIFRKPAMIHGGEMKDKLYVARKI